MSTLFAARWIAPVPQPDAGDLLAAVAGPVAGDTTLSEPWTGPAGAALWFSRGAWAFVTLARALRRARHAAPPAFWFPDYFCTGSLAGLRADGVVLRFYPVTADLAPDWPVLDAMASDGAPDAVVLVHTFGATNDTAGAADFCRRNDAVLVEDAAHALLPGDGVGATGNVVLYSPRKMLAVPDGAVLVVRDGALLGAIEEAAEALPDDAPPAGNWLARRLVQKVAPNGLLGRLPSTRQTDFTADPPATPLAQTPALSRAARRLIARADLGRIAERRAANAGALLQVWSAAAGCRPLFTDGAAPVAPYRFALRCDDGERAAALFRALAARGCPAESWPDLPPEVTADPARHETAIRLRNTVVTLPVHQSLTPDLLKRRCGPDG